MMMNAAVEKISVPPMQAHPSSSFWSSALWECLEKMKRIGLLVFGFFAMARMSSYLLQAGTSLITLPSNLSLLESFGQRDLPSLAYWLQKGDEDLLQQFDPQELNFLKGSLAACDIARRDKNICHEFVANHLSYETHKHYKKLIEQSAERGDLGMTLMLLERIQKWNKPSYQMREALEITFSKAIEKGNEELVLAVLRKNYDVRGAVLPGAVQTAVIENQPKVLAAFLSQPEGKDLLLLAGSKAIQSGRLEILQQVVEKGLSDEDFKDLVRIASEQKNKKPLEFLASQGRPLELSDPKIVANLLNIGYFPTRFSPLLISGRTQNEVDAILATYLRFGQITDRELIEAWKKSPVDRFFFLRAILVDRFSLSQELQEHIAHEWPSFSPKEQELALRIAIWTHRSESLIKALIDNSPLTVKKSILDLQKKRAEHQRRIETIKQKIIQQGGKNSSPPTWNEEEIRNALVRKGPEILRWNTGISDPNHVYFGSDDLIGQIKTMPHLVLKSCKSLENAKERISLIENIRKTCIQKNLNHLRIPQAFLITALNDANGKTVPIYLVVEELLPVAGHTMYEIKEFLSELNRDPAIRKQVNGYFSELTSLVCATGLTDLKATNVPLLEDGSGLAIVDSNMQGDSIRGLYQFNQPDHSLIDMLQEENFDALRKSLAQDPHCPKNLEDVASEREERRKEHIENEQEIARLHLLEYGNVERAPIEITDRELEALDPKTRALCLEYVDQCNQALQSQNADTQRRLILLKNFRGEGEYLDPIKKRVFEYLKRARKIHNYWQLGGHGIAVQG